MKYCVRCVIPSTKPFIQFDEAGVCNACRSHEKKKAYLSNIDWEQRRQELAEIIRDAVKKASPFYDMVVPVSGGKDSIAQVHTALEYGVRILAVNVDYGIKTEIGRRNLDCVSQMGVPLVIYRPEPVLHHRMTRIGFEDYGDPYLMSHSLLYSYPMWAAVKFDVPLVLWAENSAYEYGGDAVSGEKSRIDYEWFLKYVMTKGVTIEEMVQNYGIPKSRLLLYDFPEEAMKHSGTEGIFLGHFIPWDSESNLKTAQQYGFESLSHPGEGTFRNYVAIDEKLSRIHQYMKVIKFGYGRATDHACEEIRNGRMTRDEAIDLVKQYDGQPLSEDHIEDFCRLLHYSRAEFWNLMEKHCNADVCLIKAGGELEILGHRMLELVKQ